LLFFLLFDFGRALLHGRAVAQLEARLFENAPALETAAMPQSFNPFEWRGIVETERTYQSLPVNTLGQIDPASAQIFFKPPQEPAIEAAKRVEAFRYFSYFARFPVWSESHVTLDANPGERVELTDLRFGQPQHGGFHCIAVENARYRVLASWFNLGSGINLGWGKDGPPSTEEQ
jgi:inner membrane protein